MHIQASPAEAAQNLSLSFPTKPATKWLQFLPLSSSLAKKAARQSCKVTTGPQNQLGTHETTNLKHHWRRKRKCSASTAEAAANNQSRQRKQIHTSSHTPWRKLSSPVARTLHHTSLLWLWWGGWRSAAWPGLPCQESARTDPERSRGLQTPASVWF